ncbi:nucleic acid-binding protein [Xylaria castorea]|nr:nucleic acid-binding protein [Xylaria castorea]
MAKKCGKGGKNLRRARREESDSTNNRELLFKEAGQDYARIEKVFGSGRYNARSFSDNAKDEGVVRLAIRRGTLRSLSILPGDIVLVGLRDWQDSKADIIHKYSADEALRLHALDELPLRAVRQKKDEESVGTTHDDNDGDGVVFGYDSGEEGDDNQSGVNVDAI